MSLQSEIEYTYESKMSPCHLGACLSLSFYFFRFSSRYKLIDTLLGTSIVFKNEKKLGTSILKCLGRGFFQWLSEPSLNVIFYTIREKNVIFYTRRRPFWLSPFFLFQRKTFPKIMYFEIQLLSRKSCILVAIYLETSFC